jgi:hypothetical protein
LQEDIKDYKAIVLDLAKAQTSDMFNSQFMNNFNLQPKSSVAVVSGEAFNPELFGYNGFVPTAKHYTFFYVVPETMKSNQIKRILICNFKDPKTGCECGHIRTDFSKFFDHLRSHSGELPYKCTYEGCEHSFSFRGNLIRHLHSHMGIKKFQCEHCSQRFSNNHNLKKHMNRVH